MKAYRHYVIKTLEALENSHGYIFAQLLNLASSGEMKDIMLAFETGDTYDFQYAHFEDLQDTNIQKLIGLLRHIDQTFKTIKEENNILGEEIFPERNREDRFNGDDNDFL
ncbi:hypothetical protein [Sphingobacterium hotanense]|uniref:Uncharacterized protein n=1 Tax=Sphingobacterium hotanense TaxID=649196 RepID=A0ABT7NSA9_9SPHI|nr:hypothetical protein [Sphingobacterium hotanense]MDM1050144.1 hypothetical protein [Sphingobacterium hotanense]